MVKKRCLHKELFEKPFSDCTVSEDVFYFRALFYLECFGMTKQMMAIIFRLGLDGDKPKTYKEIADSMGVSTERTRHYVFKALRTLRHINFINFLNTGRPSDPMIREFNKVHFPEKTNVKININKKILSLKKLRIYKENIVWAINKIYHEMEDGEETTRSG